MPGVGPEQETRPTSRPLLIDLHPRRLRAYGCVLCQKTHREGDPLYPDHLYRQSKHGTYIVQDEGHWTYKW